MAIPSVVRFVKGYHEITGVPQLAIDNHLEHRFAVVLDSGGEGTCLSDEEFAEYIGFKANLSHAIIREISQVIEHDDLRIIQPDGWRIKDEGGLEFKTVDSLITHVLAIPEEDREVPLRIQFFKKGDVVCVEETEFWGQCGGPWPYGDGDTLSFYTSEDMSERFISICLAICKRFSVPVGEVVLASICPVHVPWWKVFFRWVIDWRLPW